MNSLGKLHKNITSSWLACIGDYLLGLIGSTFEINIKKSQSNIVLRDVVVFCLEIIIYQADSFIQTHKTTEAYFTCPPGHCTSILTMATFTYPRQLGLFSFLS